MEIYVDESGNLGKQGKYFVVTALVVCDNSGKKGKRLKNIVKHFLANSSRDEIKGAELSVPERQSILKLLKKTDDHWFFYICLDKENLTQKNLFVDKSLIFNFLCKFLFTKIIQDLSPVKLDVFVDQRNVKHNSIHGLREYLNLEINSQLEKHTSINLGYYDSKTVKLIQIADLVSGIVHNRYTNKQKHEYGFVKIRGSILFPFKTFGT